MGDLRKYVLILGFVFTKEDGEEVQISGKFNQTKGCLREGNGGGGNRKGGDRLKKLTCPGRIYKLSFRLDLKRRGENQ